MKRLFMAVAIVLPLAVAVPCAGQDDPIGKPGDMAKATRTVNIEMSDFMLFNPSDINVRKNDTIHFVVANKGQLKHEFVFGTASDLQAHAFMMQKNPDMVHTNPGHYTLEPGTTQEFAWQFTTAGTVEFACLFPGHYDSGMKGTVTVKP